MAMEKAEMASYLASICSIMDSIDDGGAQLRPQWLVEEYHRTWDAFKDTVQQEKEDEARKRAVAQRQHEARTHLSSDQPGRGEPYRNDGRSGDGTAGRGSGLQGPGSVGDHRS